MKNVNMENMNNSFCRYDSKEHQRYCQWRRHVMIYTFFTISILAQLLGTVKGKNHYKYYDMICNISFACKLLLYKPTLGINYFVVTQFY